MDKFYDKTTNTLIIPHFVNETLNNIPEDTKYIFFGKGINMYSVFNTKINENVLPKNLHTLCFGYYYDQEISKNVLPINLHILRFGSIFDTIIDENVLPKYLHTINFGYYHNQKLKKNTLSKYLHTISFGHNYNQEVTESVLPTYLHTVHFGVEFNQKIRNNELSTYLHTIRFGNGFFQTAVLPQTLKYIELYSNCNLINNLPNSIETVRIYFSIFDDLKKEIINLPFSVNKIIIDERKNLKYLVKIPLGCIVEIQNTNYYFEFN